MGSTISATLERAISDIVFNVVRTLFQDLASEKNNAFVTESLDIAVDALTAKEQNEMLSSIIANMVNKSLDLVIEQVEVKQWLLKELEEKERRKQERRQRHELKLQELG